VPLLAAALLVAASLSATLDVTTGPGANYEKAEFRLWLPESAAPLRAVLVLVPGSNGDGRPDVLDPVWQGFARREGLALVGCRLTDRPHEQEFIEEYADASRGSGEALFAALATFAARASRAEIASAPLLLWGMSAGGQFNYELVAWRPERVAAFVVNKGGVYYSALLPAAARRVPGLLFVGGKDMEFRTRTIEGLFAVNRRAGALWALVPEPSVGHDVGRSRELALLFFADVLRTGPLSEAAGFVGEPREGTIRPASAALPDHPTAWLPTERSARAWRALATDRPLEP
jgi:poly(3-hydroxybutyrate) depolymerase